MESAAKLPKANQYPLNRLAFPVFCELFLQLLIGNLDQIMISRCSLEAVAAVGNVNQVLALTTTVFSAFSAAAMVMISRYRGSGDQRLEETAYPLTFVLSLLFGCALSIFFLLFGESVLLLMGTGAAVASAGRPYFSLVGGTVFLQALFFLFSAFLKSDTKMKEVMFLSIGMNVLNTLMNFLLIHGHLGFPALGVTGAAVATVLSRLLGLCGIAFLFWKTKRLAFSFKRLTPFPFFVMKDFLILGVPPTLETFSYNLTQVLIMAMVNGFGIAAVNARIYVSLLTRLPYLYTKGLGQASQVYVGRAIGAGACGEAKRLMDRGMKTAFFISLALSVTLFLCSDGILRLFTEDEEVLRLGKTLLFIDMFVQLGRSFNLLLIGALQAAKDTVVPVAMVIAAGWLCSVAGGYLFGVVLKWGLVGIWCALILDENVRGLLCLWRWKKGIWEQKAVMVAGKNPV